MTDEYLAKCRGVLEQFRLGKISDSLFAGEAERGMIRLLDEIERLRKIEAAARIALANWPSPPRPKWGPLSREEWLYLLGNSEGDEKWKAHHNRIANLILSSLRDAEASGREKAVEECAKRLDQRAVEFKEASAKEPHSPGNKAKEYAISGAVYALAAAELRSLPASGAAYVVS